MKHFRTTLVAALALSTLAPCVQAQEGMLSRIRNSIGSLWGQKASQRESARKARQHASSLNAQAETARQRLQKAQQLLLRANAVYNEYSLQAKQTEARIARTRRRVRIVTVRYQRHQQLFGERLASIQRNGQLSYLTMLLGSRTLSDLSRRMYLYQAIVERDADLQEALKDDKFELERAENMLMSQWQQRNRLLQAANRERSRVLLAERAQERSLKAIKNKVYERLSAAEARVQSAAALDSQINALESQRVRLIAAARAERQREYASYQPRRRSRRYWRYRRARVVHRVRRVEYRRRPGGVLEPMTVKDIVYEDVMVPDTGSGELGESFENSDDASISEGVLAPAQILH